MEVRETPKPARPAQLAKKKNNLAAFGQGSKSCSFCFLLFESKNSFLFLPKAVKSRKKLAFWPIYCYK